MSTRTNTFRGLAIAGVVGAFGAALLASACSGDNGSGSDAGLDGTSGSSGSSSGATSSSGSSSGATSSSGSSSGATSSSSGSSSGTTSSSSGGTTEGGTEAGPTCNTAAMLLTDGGTLLFSFDDGGISENLGSGTATWASAASGFKDPADAGLTPSAVTVAGSTTLGVTCPGALTVEAPFSTLGQAIQVSFKVPAQGVLEQGSLLHFAFRILVPNDADASAAYAALQGPTNGSYGFINFYVQGTYPLADGGLPLNDAGEPVTYAKPPAGINFPPLLVPNSLNLSSGAVQEAVLNINQSVSPDGGPESLPFYLNEIGFQLVVPAITDAGAAPLAGGPFNVEVVVDDIWIQ